VIKWWYSATTYITPKKGIENRQLQLAKQNVLDTAISQITYVSADMTTVAN